MKYEDLKGKSADELKTLILDGKKELFNLRFQRTTGELDKTHRFQEIRKDIARINTYMTSGETIAAAPKAKKEKAPKAEKAEKAPKVKATKKKEKAA